MAQHFDSDFDMNHLQSLPYQTPYFLFSKKNIEESYRLFTDHFPHAKVYYSMKANAEQEVLSILRDLGSGFEVASKYELDMLKPLNIPPSKIIYGTSVKPLDHIQDFFAYGVDTYAADSKQELEKIAVGAPGSKIYIRLVTNDAGSVFKFSEKFGTEKENVVSLMLHARSLGLIPHGLSFNVGSQSGESVSWKNEILSLTPILTTLKEHGITIEILDIGGGFPSQYASSTIVPTVEEIANNVHDALATLPYTPRLILEPGRRMVANAGIIVASVIARVERKGSVWLFLDAGVYNGLFETMAYQGSTRYPIINMRAAHGVGEMMFAIAGPTGDSPDIVTREVLLPTDTDVGDKLVIYNTGAYSLVCTCPFNGFPKPCVYFL